MNENIRSRLKKLERKNIPDKPKLEDVLIDPELKVIPDEDHQKKFAEMLGVDYEELYGERIKP